MQMSSILSLLLSVLLTALSLKANAYQMYQGYIPNGDKVPNPCNRSTTWPGVGHQAVYGAGARNPFGLDFAANNRVWNSTLCQKDSDGDGMTNGQELGDPNCIWMMGGRFPPALSTNLSHPGVCEPVGSPRCAEKNSWLMDCMPGKFNCSAINAPGVRNHTLRLPMTPVPTKETTYICYRFKLPNDSVSDIIAIKPVIDNAHVLHHIVLYACNDEPMDSPEGKPFECGMMSCRSMIGVWGVGGVGQCLNSQLGFRIGPNGGFQYAVLQLHWNNPEGTANLVDSSGMMIYYTSQLRPNRGQVGIVGQLYLEIPPGKPEVTFTGNCSSRCSQNFPRSIFLTSAALHLHKLGKSGEIRLSRNGQLLRMLDTVTQYDYNTPTMTEFHDPIEVKPGDDIQVKCTYDSTQKNKTTYFGEATSDEMCFGFFDYYPLLDDLGFCGQWRTIDVCNDRLDSKFPSCDLSTLLTLLAIVPSVCSRNCSSIPCALIMDGAQDTECYNFPDVKKFVYAFMPNSSVIFDRCAMVRPPKPHSPCTTQPDVSDSPFQGVSTTQPVLYPINGSPFQGVSTEQPALYTINGSPFPGVSLGFCLVLTLMAHAAFD